MQTRYLIVAVIVAVLVIAGIWWWQASDEAEPAPEVVVEEASPVEEPAPPPVSEPEPEPEVAEGPPPEPPLPELNQSDELVREEVAALSENERLDQWLENEELVRRLAVVIDNAAKGDYPRRQLRFLAPSGKFQVIEENGRITIDPAGYRRYDPLVEAATSIPPEQAASLLLRIEPLLADALAELGYQDADPSERMLAAIEDVLATPVLEGEIELVQPKVVYKFADPRLEALPPLRRQLLRMGPENVERLKEYARALRDELRS